MKRENIVAEKSPLLIERTHSEMGWVKPHVKVTLPSEFPCLYMSKVVKYE